MINGRQRHELPVILRKVPRCKGKKIKEIKEKDKGNIKYPGMLTLSGLWLLTAVVFTRT
jgi:hypothetical protein